MEIVSAYQRWQNEASKLQQQLNSIKLSYRNLGRKERRQSFKETAHVCKRESQNSEGAKSTVGEGEGREEKCLAPFVQLKLTSVRPFGCRMHPKNPKNQKILPTPSTKMGSLSPHANLLVSTCRLTLAQHRSGSVRDYSRLS